MNLRQASLAAIAAVAFAVGPARVDAASHSSQLPSGRHVRSVVLRTSDLRSAYLIRSGQVRYDETDATPAGHNRQLERHFDTVIALLLLSTPQSIELALDRLEAREQTSWSPSARDEWRQRLLANRRSQIVRLIAYRNRGLFPQNDGQSKMPTPIFVDNHDIACAVGHLMRISGRERDVAEIQHHSNLVYVPEVTAGPVVAWMLTSGITLEEAALIQPAYGTQLHPISENAIEVVDETASFHFGDLRFSNFKKFTVAENNAIPAVNIPVTHQFCSWFSCTTVIGFFSDPWNGGIVDSAGGYSRIVVEFDVEVTTPDLRIANRPIAGTLMSNVLFHGNQLELFANGARDRLWVDYSPRNWPVFVTPDGSQLTPVPIQSLKRDDGFQPTDRLTVVTEMLLQDGQPHQSQYINFDLIAVPEPATTFFVVLAIGWIGTARVRRHR
jgi:hypothetical protein